MRLVQILERAAQIHPSGIGTRHAGRTQTWLEVHRRVQRLAAGLTSLGLGPGDRVALLAANSDRFFEAAFAIAWAGGVVQPVNLRVSGAEAAHQLADAGTRLILFDEAGLPLLESACTGASPATAGRKLFLGNGRPPLDAVRYDEVLGRAAPSSASSRSGDDLAALLYTGGTTGKPKGVMLSHRNLVSSALSAAHALGERREDVILHAFPMFHIAGLVSSIRAVIGCCASVFLPRFNPLDWLAIVAEERVTRSSMVPTMLKTVLDHPRRAEFDLSSLRWLLYGAAPMPEVTLEVALAELPTVGLVQGYGQTESSSTVTLLPSSRHVLTGPGAGKLRSAGQVLAGSELAILDPEGGRVPMGTVGEICIHGDNVMLGYWNRPEETAAALAGGWLHTGDVGYLDEDGFLFIVDRLKDMIITGGENVFTAEVENVLSHHPAIAECAVIGVPDLHWGERVHAVVRLKEGMAADDAALLAHCAARMARYKCPKSIEFRTEPLPLSAMGKMLKTALREAHGQAMRVSD
jgi:acyl-CoA synthetase (AMP-forming)/AMP-acid ligase II